MDLPGTTTPYASFSQNQPKTNSYFRNRISKAKATSASHTQAIFTGCLPLASLSLASFLLLAGRLLWRFLEETKRKRDTRNTKHGEEHGRETNVSFVFINPFSPNFYPGKPLMKRPDPQTLLLCSTSPITWHREFAVVAAPVHGIPATQDAEAELYSSVSQNKAVTTTNPMTFFLPLRVVENSLSDQYRLSALFPRCPWGSQT